MTTTQTLLLLSLACGASASPADESESPRPKWTARFDIGGSMPKDPSLTLLDGPVTGGDKMELSPGMQFDFAVGYRLRPWLTLEAELGTTFNEIDSVGNWSYPNSSLSQLSIMANVMIEYPRWPLKPFAGIGAGGVYSSVTFGNYYYYYYNDSDGYGTDFVPAAQAFAGVRYEFNEQWSVGVMYRFLATAEQKWDVDWWTGADFDLGVDSVYIHSVCLVFTGRF